MQCTCQPSGPALSTLKLTLVSKEVSVNFIFIELLFSLELEELYRCMQFVCAHF